jgi:60 kDa SS-A/Ro ribonucleoprotein
LFPSFNFLGGDMSSVNTATKTAKYTHEGAKASNITKKQELRRSVTACMLWENTFYEDGKAIADRIKELVHQLPGQFVSELAIEAREKMKLRHVPLFLVRELARHPKKAERQFVSDTLARVIQRPDELTEYIAIYWKDGKEPLSAQSKLGLAKAFLKFNEYSFAKYTRDGAVKLRDALFLSHAKPGTKEQEKLFKKIVDNTLVTPDTWEVALSGGADKKETFTRLLKEGKLGALALLRNLRNMSEAGVSTELVTESLENLDVIRVLPFRFISAAKYAPQLESVLEKTMFKALESHPELPGKTVMIVDVSGSMGGNVSGKSEIGRVDAAASLAILLREICEDFSIYATAGNDYSRIHKTALIPSRHGFALKDSILKSKNELGGGGIFLKQVMDYVYNLEKSNDVARIIVITDEQDCDTDPAKSPSKANTFGANNYLINIANEKNGIGYDKWVHIDGFSEAVIDYIQAFEDQGDED